MMTRNVQVIFAATLAILVVMPFLIKKDNSFIDVYEINNSFDIPTSIANIKNTDIVFVKLKFKNAGILHNAINKHGISAVIGELLFKNINGLSQSQTRAQIIDNGIVDLSVETKEDSFDISFLCTHDRLEYALKFITKIFNENTLKISALEQAKQMYPQNTDLNFVSGHDLSIMKLRSMLFADSNYGLNNTGSSSAIASITLDDVKNFIKHSLNRNNLSVFFAGDISRFEASKYIEIICKNISDFKNTNKSSTIADSTAEEIAYVIKENANNVVTVCFGIRIDELSDIDKATVYVLLNAIFRNDIGDFTQGLRSRKLAYNVNFSFDLLELSNIINVVADIREKDLEKYIRYIKSKCLEYSNKVHNSNIEIMKKYFIENIQSGVSNLNNVDDYIELSKLPFDKINREDIKRVSSFLFNQARVKIVVVSSGKK